MTLILICCHLRFPADCCSDPLSLKESFLGFNCGLTFGRKLVWVDRCIKAGNTRVLNIHARNARPFQGCWVSVQMRIALRAFASFEMHVIQVVWPFYLVLRIIKKKNRSSRWRVHPVNSERYIQGQFYTLYCRLREDSDKFFNYFRMSAASFDELLCHKELCNA
jgi:hypothetical protein